MSFYEAIEELWPFMKAFRKSDEKIFGPCRYILRDMWRANKPLIPVNFILAVFFIAIRCMGGWNGY